jgi:hypothetical protein
MEGGQSLSQALQWQDNKYNYCHVSQWDSECKTVRYIQYSLYSRTFTYHYVCVCVCVCVCIRISWLERNILFH